MAPTCSKEVIDNVDDLLLRDEAIIAFGVLAVLEQGSCDVLDSVLRGQEHRGILVLHGQISDLAPAIYYIPGTGLGLRP